MENNNKKEALFLNWDNGSTIPLEKGKLQTDFRLSAKKRIIQLTLMIATVP